MKNTKMGRPRKPASQKLTSRSIAFSEAEIDFLQQQDEPVSKFVRQLVRKLMDQAKEGERNGNK